MFVDQKDESCLVPLNEAINASKGRLELANSSLSESAVLGALPCANSADSRLRGGDELGDAQAPAYMGSTGASPAAPFSACLLTQVRRFP
jgi:hypothetical protein